MDRDVDIVSLVLGGARRPPEPPPNLDAFVWYNRGTPAIALTPTGDVDSFSVGSGLWSMFATVVPPYSASYFGSFCTVTDAVNAPNNGTFTLRTSGGANQGILLNPSGLSEPASPARYRFQGVLQAITDLSPSARVFVMDTSTSNFVIRDDLIVGQKLLTEPGANTEGSPVARRMVNASLGSLYVGDVSASFSARLMFPNGAGSHIVMFVTPAALNSTDSMTARVLSPTQLRLQRGGISYDVTLPTPIAAGAWLTLGWRYDATTHRLTAFVDGVPVATSPAGAAYLLVNPTVVGLGSCVGVATTRVHFKGFAMNHTAWTDAQFLAVHRAFLAFDSFYPYSD